MPLPGANRRNPLNTIEKIEIKKIENKVQYQLDFARWLIKRLFLFWRRHSSVIYAGQSVVGGR